MRGSRVDVTLSKKEEIRFVEAQQTGLVWLKVEGFKTQLASQALCKLHVLEKGEGRNRLRPPAGKLFSPCLANALVSIFSQILTGASRSPARFASPRIPPCRCLPMTNTAGSRLAQVTAK